MYLPLTFQDPPWEASAALRHSSAYLLPSPNLIGDLRITRPREFGKKGQGGGDIPKTSELQLLTTEYRLTTDYKLPLTLIL